MPGDKFAKRISYHNSIPVQQARSTCTGAAVARSDHCNVHLALFNCSTASFDKCAQPSNISAGPIQDCLLEVTCRAIAKYTALEELNALLRCVDDDDDDDDEDEDDDDDEHHHNSLTENEPMAPKSGLYVSALLDKSGIDIHSIYS